MIRKRYLAAAGLLTLAVVAAGCGKKNDAGSVVQTTPTPTEETSYSRLRRRRWSIWKKLLKRISWVRRHPQHQR